MNIEKVAGSMVVAVRAYVAWSIERFAQTFTARVEAIERRVEQVPTSIKGDQGDRGERGEKGDAGERGAEGEKGEQGEPGERGEIGEPGAPGDPGADGDAGERGEPGEPGAPGEIGERGVKGDAGAAGANAFEVAKSSGFVGSEGDWLLSLRGKDGAPGLRGDRGADGLPGENGARGDNGRDALEIANVLNGIDTERSYQRGTAASLLGGTFWATRATDAVIDGDYVAAGWVCLMRGIADETQRDEERGRFHVRTVTYSDGTEQEFRRKTVAIIDQGVYQSGKAYDAGDAVTYGGSVFIAQRDTKAAPGNGGDEWRLAVKRGKDGKDLT